MKTTVSLYDFRDAFVRAGRKDQFSYEALELIYNYLEDQENDTGYEYELDVIGLCCELAEQSPEAIAADYSYDVDENENDDEIAKQVMEFLCDQTTVLGTTAAGDIVYVQF
jgi:hypothetical protein